MERHIILKLTQIELNILNTYSHITSIRYSDIISFDHKNYNEQYPHICTVKCLVRIPEETPIMENKTYSFKTYIQKTKDDYVKNIMKVINEVTENDNYPKKIKKEKSK